MNTEDLIIYTTNPYFMSITASGYFSMIYILTKYMKEKNHIL